MDDCRDDTVEVGCGLGVELGTRVVGRPAVNDCWEDTVEVGRGVWVELGTCVVDRAAADDCPLA